MGLSAPDKPLYRSGWLSGQPLLATIPQAPTPALSGAGPLSGSSGFVAPRPLNPTLRVLRVVVLVDELQEALRSIEGLRPTDQLLGNVLRFLREKEVLLGRLL